MAPEDRGSIADQLTAQVRELLQGAEEQAKQVMAAAETEVAKIRETAAAQGHRRIEEARRALDDIEDRLGAPEPPAPAAPAPEPPVAKPEPATEPEPLLEPEPATEPGPLPEPEPAAAKPKVAPAAGGDESAARLVAMKMALDGTSRDEVRATLAEDYSVADLDGLLADVFAKAGK